MRKRFLVTMLAVVFSATILVGCGSGNDAPAETMASSPVADTATPMPEETPVTAATEAPKMTVPESAADDDFGRPPEDECVSDGWMGEESTESTEAVVTEPGEVEGIVVVQSYYRTDSSGKGNNFFYEINSVAPSDGTINHIATFSYYQPYNVNNAEFYFFSCNIGINNHIGYDRKVFSNDFSKMAITICYTARNETHAGWIDQNGNFFDVTEALGEQASDFDDPVHYAAVGFTDDGLFVYNDNLYAYADTWSTLNFRYTDSTNPINSQEGNPLSDYDPIIQAPNVYCISDINDARYLVSTPSFNACESFIYDSNTAEIASYIPGNARINWSGVFSPEGGKIAFLSQPKEGSGTPEIFVISSDSGEPEKINCNLNLSNNLTTMPSALLEWR